MKWVMGGYNHKHLWWEFLIFQVATYPFAFVACLLWAERGTQTLLISVPALAIWGGMAAIALDDMFGCEVPK